MRKFLELRENDTKLKMMIRLLCYMIRHPKRAYSLLFKIKKGKVGFGDHHLDICYLKYGEIRLKKEENPEVSIIIPVYNQLLFTYKCLLSIIKNTNDVSYEVIIADDVSTDGTRFLNSYTSNVNIVRNKKNLRFLRNCNNASKSAKGKYVLFLNNDTEVKEKWLSSLVELIESDKTIGMVGSKLIFPDGKLQEAGGIIFNDGSGANYGKFDDASKPQYNYVRDVDYISGASIMLSNKLWKEIGGFDDTFAPAYCEDSDLAFEIRRRGLRVVYQPKSVVVHYEGVSNGVNVNNVNSLKHYQVVNVKKLKEKWKKELMKLPFPDTNPMNIKHRDRINGKKVVLVVDHYVPEFDKDAGSKTTFQYLKMLVDKGYIVKFLGDNFYNKEPYTGVLQQMGIEVLYGIDYRNTLEDWIYENKNNIDVIYLNRPHISVKYIDFIKKNTDIKVIYYGHDLHFLREKREYEITKDKKHLEDSDYWKEIELEMMRKSDVVYYPSYIEKELINSIDPKINVKAINAYIFDNIDLETNYDFTKKEGIMFIGGFTHRPNVDAVLWFTKEIYPLIYEKIKVPFYIVGSNPPKEIIDLQSIPGVIIKGYVTEEELDELYKKCKMAMIPLRYGAGIKGKVVEAMSKGIPFVTTSCGAEGIVGIEKFVPVVDKEQAFAKSVIELYSDNEKLSKISLEERKYIDKNFSTDAAFDIIKDDFSRRNDFVVLTPDGYGSKGDEAMIRGALSLIIDRKIKLVSQRKDFWNDYLNNRYYDIEEKYYELADFKKSIGLEKKMIIIGADLIDGTQNIESSISRLEAAKKISEDGGECFIFCSFRSNADPKIVRYIKALNDNVKFYLRDEISMKNFINQTRRECSYFPDFAFFARNNDKCNDKEILKTIDKLEELKLDYNLIGINFSETSFRSLFSDYTDENRVKYVTEVIEKVIEKVKNPYFILICHDVRHWDNYYSDADFNSIALDILKKKNVENVIKLDKNLNHLELLYILEKLDTVITGRMHLAIAGFKSHTIPIVYTGIGKYKFSMNDKMHGMFINRIGDDSFVTHDLDSLGEALEKIIYDYYDCLKLIDYLKKVEIKDFDYYVELSKILNEEKDIERNLILF